MLLEKVKKEVPKVSMYSSPSFVLYNLHVCEEMALPFTIVE